MRTTLLRRTLAVGAVALAAAASAAPAAAQLTTINFNDGSAPFGDVLGIPVGARYAALGLTFTNASYYFGPRAAPLPGTDGLVIVATNGGAFPQATNPIVGTFSFGVDFVSILAYAAGPNGARIDVYDAVTGGNLIGRQDLPIGGAEFGTLSVSRAGIRRFELYQPNTGFTNGTVFDNLAFRTGAASVVPEPSTYALLAAGLAGVGAVARRRRRATTV